LRRGPWGALLGLRRPWGLRGPRLRHVLEIMSGVLIANVGDIFNVFVSAYFAWALRTYPIILALLPGLANLRGGNMSAMAARISTRLQLGIGETSISGVMRSEAPAAVVASFAASVIIALMAAAASGISGLRAIAAAGISSALVLVAMIPFTVFVAVWVYRRGVNPDNVAAPVLTVVGDIVSIPSLVLAALLIASRSVEGIAAFLTLWAAFTGLVVAARLGGRLASTVRDLVVAMILTAVVESIAGGVLSRARAVLYTAGLIHIVASLLEDTGASASVVTSRSSTIIHLYGPERLLAYAPAMMAEALLGTLPNLLVLTGLGIAWGRILGLPLHPRGMLTAIVGGGSLIVALGSAMGVGVAAAAYKLSLDPDNAALPLITALVDLTGSLVIATLARGVA